MTKLNTLESLSKLKNLIDLYFIYRLSGCDISIIIWDCSHSKRVIISIKLCIVLRIIYCFNRLIRILKRFDVQTLSNWNCFEIINQTVKRLLLFGCRFYLTDLLYALQLQLQLVHHQYWHSTESCKNYEWKKKPSQNE